MEKDKQQKWKKHSRREAVSIIRTNGYNEALNINNDQMTTKSGIFEIRADYNDKEIAVFAEFGSIIAEKAIASQKLLPPFAYDRMTWIKPSFLWLMYRSEWGNKAGMERILKIWIRRQDWDAALTEAILTTPEKHVYDNPKKWRDQLQKARIRVQWDPERDLQNNRLAFKSIQVGITSALSEHFAKKWIVRIEDVTAISKQIRRLLNNGDYKSAKKLLPDEREYPVNNNIAKVLGMG
jgi:hypothetical protein